MNNTSIKINAIYPLSGISYDRLLNLLQEVELPKGHLLFKAGKIESYLYFIEKGIARAYIETESRDVTFWFGQEQDIVFSYQSYMNAAPGYENVELLESSLLYRVDTHALLDLYKQDVELANWGRKLIEQELLKTEKLFISRQFKTAADCYRELIENNPQLLQRVSLGHIASYLGITQVTLSRIRSEIK